MSTWEVSPACDWNSGIELPAISGQHCGTLHSPARWECNRLAGHTGRHAATGSPAFGESARPLYAVWGGAA